VNGAVRRVRRRIADDKRNVDIDVVFVIAERVIDVIE
jgi:hypothetical protein